MPANNCGNPWSLDPLPAAEYAPAMDLPDLKDDPYLKLVRPLVEAYQAFWLADNRHIRSLKLTPSQFDVIATLGDTDGMTCSELSARTLVTKGTLTGVLDRLVAKGVREITLLGQIVTSYGKREKRDAWRVTSDTKPALPPLVTRHLLFSWPSFSSGVLRS